MSATVDQNGVATLYIVGPGLGYSHNSGPAIGGLGSGDTPLQYSSTFFGSNIKSLLPPNLTFGRSKKKSKKKSKKLKFGRRYCFQHEKEVRQWVRDNICAPRGNVGLVEWYYKCDGCDRIEKITVNCEYKVGDRLKNFQRKYSNRQ